MRFSRLSKHTLILSIFILQVGCDSNLTPDPDTLERAHPAPVGSSFTFDQYILDSLGNIIVDHYRNNTFTDSIVSSGTTLGIKNNVTTFRRTAKDDSLYYRYHYYNFEDNGDLSVCYDDQLIDTFWTTYPIESRKPIIYTYYDSNASTGYVTRKEAVYEYDSTVSIIIGSTTLKAHKIKEQQTITRDSKTGYKSVTVYKAYLIIVPSIGYIVEWRNEPAIENGFTYGYEGVVWILRDFHLR